MNANNLSLYMNAQALIIEAEGMRATNQAEQQKGEPIPYTEGDFARISSHLNELANHTTSD